MDLKKLGKAFLFPHIAIMLPLLPLAAVLLVGSMLFVGTNSVIALIAYVLSAYTLLVWCLKIPYLIQCLKTFREKNEYARKWRNNPRFRVKVSLHLSLVWNVLYGILHLGLGIYHYTFWFCSLGAYYFCLAAMRLFLVRHTAKYAPGERIQIELVKYRACGIVFLSMNVALALIVFFMVYFGRSFEHHLITTIAVAAYTFTALTVAIANVIKYKKYNSPVFSASTAISLAAALVSMLTLESTMLTTFSSGAMTVLEQKWMLGATGAAVSLLIVSTAIYMIITGTKKLKHLNLEVENGKQ